MRAESALGAEIGEVALDSERREWLLLRNFFGVSILAHMLVYGLSLLNLSRPLPPLQNEWTIDTDLVADYESKGAPALSALPEAEPNPETKIPDTLLPQLPKQFALPEPDKEDEGLPDPDKAQEQPEKDEGKVESKDKTDIRTLEAQRDDAQKVEAQDALRRAALERLRKQAKPETKSNQAPEQSELARVSEALANKNIKDLRGAGEGLAVNRYEKIVYQAVKRRYVLPTTYKQLKATLYVVIAIVVNVRGELMSAEVSQSSQDATFDQLTLQAAQEATPFAPPPKSLAGVKFYLRFTP